MTPPDVDTNTQLRVACVQLNSGDDAAANLLTIRDRVEEAAKRGAQLITLPENALLMQPEFAKLQAASFAEGAHPGIASCRALAKEHGIWLLIGSVAVQPEIPDPQGRLLNRSLLINPEGMVAARYDKIHLFDVDLGSSDSSGGQYRESARMIAGTTPTLADTPWGKIGMSVCYDVRFPHLYRTLAQKGASLLTVPSAFTRVTGQAHWHVLLRARAIETGCFVIAPAQCGKHPGNRETYGHSLIISPWGEILAEAGDTEEVIVADVELAEVATARRRIPSSLTPDL
jgi:predicted amidohydrolase